jgi:hypothetical protein
MPPKQYAKFKSWRKGKSTKNAPDAESKGKKMSLKNRLRGQKRLLAKLTEKEEDSEVVRQRIQDIERQIKESELKERQKKNNIK